MDFLFFVMGDEEIFDSLMNNKTLSEKSAAKLKDFFRDNKGFSDFMLTVFNDPTSPECLKKLSESQKRKLITITIDQMDFTQLLSATATDPSQDKAAQAKLQAAIAADKDLGADVGKCFADNENNFKVGS